MFNLREKFIKNIQVHLDNIVKMSEKLDVIIFGASGFTGKYTVLEAVKILENLKWGVAGRNKEKLEKVLKEMGEKANTDLSKIPIIIADVNDEESLTEMAKRCKIVVNCCGPYRFFGEPVVKACVEAGTHHVDVSGEPQYMETMQLKYDEKAREMGVYVISACGFDSIPADLGTVFVEKQFDGVVNSVEAYLETWVDPAGDTGGAIIHYGTWESAIYGLAHANELRGIRSALHKSKLPTFRPKLSARPIIHNSPIINSYCLPFPGSDRSVVMRSQRIFYETKNKRPVQMLAYVGLGSLMATISVAVFAVFFGLLARFSFGRSLLLKYPKLFSFGFFSHEGPSEKKMENTHFSMTFYAKGWPQKLEEPTDQYTDPPTKTLKAKVTGRNPGYGATCVALLVSAVTVLHEHSKMPGVGGVLPPGAAFAETNMIQELQKYENGMKFEVISKD